MDIVGGKRIYFNGDIIPPPPQYFVWGGMERNMATIPGIHNFWKKVQNLLAHGRSETVVTSLHDGSSRIKTARNI